MGNESEKDSPEIRIMAVLKDETLQQTEQGIKIVPKSEGDENHEPLILPINKDVRGNAITLEQLRPFLEAGTISTPHRMICRCGQQVIRIESARTSQVTNGLVGMHITRHFTTPEDTSQQIEQCPQCGATLVESVGEILNRGRANQPE